MTQPTTESLDLSVIIPTLNEADNLALLVPRLHAALSPRRYELIIVDDNSQDNTPAVCAELAQSYQLRLIVRRQPKDGLSGAVMEGIAAARGEVLLVMDADLQHPPEKAPELVEVIENNRGDFALGSRHVAGATSDEHWGLFRRLNSWVATLLARPFAGHITDPMSGFFALRRSTYQGAKRLLPLGYKIGLELICKTECQRLVEVPIHFGLRHAGHSKLTVKQQFKYLEHLSRLYDFCFPRLSPIIKFIIATGMAWFVGLGAFFFSLLWTDDLAVAAAIAYACGLGITLIFFMRYVRTQRAFIVRKHPWIDFVFTSLGEWAGAALTATYLDQRLDHARPLEVFVLAFLAGTMIRYVMRKEFSQDIRGLRRQKRREETPEN
ncbi:MAG: polyprenol monophosphomannose synthase [Phycisphaerales bacterium]|nr:polyprenol monophosphomannose synthase [Phycisphaerales bacterium]